MDPADLSSIRADEHLAHATWPCAEQELRGAWILRAAAGWTRRANSVLVDGPWPGDDADAVLAEVRGWYEARGLEPCLKITPLAPPGLDERLEADGWAAITRTRVMGRNLSPLPGGAAAEGSLRLQDSLDAGWLGLHAAWERETPCATARNEALLRRMDRPLFLSWDRDGTTVAVLVASLRGERAHLYSLVVDPSWRGRGIGRAFLAAALGALSASGVRDVVLQVLETNDVACRLYASMGFHDRYGYHYRVAMRCGSPTIGC